MAVMVFHTHSTTRKKLSRLQPFFWGCLARSSTVILLLFFYVKGDDIVEENGVTVFIDPKALFYVIGTVMDFNEGDMGSEFTFVNPNSKGDCGCGESFNV